MQTDLYSKVILTLVAACLVLLVVQGFGLGGGVGSVPATSPATPGSFGPYRVAPVGRMIIRFDTETGETWRLAPQSDPPVWTPVGEPGSEAAQAAQAAEPSPATAGVNQPAAPSDPEQAAGGP